MNSLKFSLAFTLLLINTQFKPNLANEAGIYTAISSPVIYPNSQYTVTVFLENQNSRAPIPKFFARIACVNSTFQSDVLTPQVEQPGQLRINVGKIHGSTCNLTLTSDPDISGRNEGTREIQVGREDFIFIHTDKPLYKPNDTVQFRVILLDRESKPKSHQIDVKIRDSKRNLIKLWKSVATDNHGVFTSELGLSHEPNMGIWTIVASVVSSTVGDGSAPTMKKDAYFNVTEYVLPKFGVEVDLPQYAVIKAMKPIPVTVRARYTFGEGLQGTCKVDVSLFSKTCNGNTRVLLNTLQFPLDGSATMEIGLDKKVEKANNGSKLEFTVTVTENATGRTFVMERIVPLFLYPYQIKPVEKISYHRRGLPFLVDFQILDRDGARIRNAGDSVDLTHNFADRVSPYTVPVVDGVVQCNFTETSAEPDERFIQITYKSLTLRYVVPERKRGRSRPRVQNSLVIETFNRDRTHQSVHTVLVKSSVALGSLNYIVVSNQVIAYAGRQTITPARNQFPLNVTIPHDISSDAALFLFTYIDQEYIGDFVQIRDTFKGLNITNFLDISISNNKLEPGQILKLTMKSKADSKIYLRAVDESVFLLAKDTDLTEESIEEEFKSNKMGGKESFDLRRSGAVVFTNSKQHDDNIYRYVRDPLELSCPINRMGSSSGQSQVLAAFGGNDDERRSYFPETWLWEELDLSNESLIKSYKVPDTLTSWTITGYSLNPSAGIGFLAPAQKLTTFKNFFITLDLPYSVVQGETLLLKTVIHNYLPGATNRSISVSFNRADDEFVLGNGALDQNQKSISIPPNSVRALIFAITPKKVGQIKLQVEASTTGARDAIELPLRVTPFGQKTVITESKILMNSSTIEFTTDFPPGVDRNVGHVKLSFSSDILAAAVDNLDHLIELPVGCGEQNMMKFVVDLAVLEYLNSTGQLKSDVERKIIRFLEIGYQRELIFRRGDGSFSLFGESDPAGSTWLTAFVIRYFLIAREYISIDDDVITRGLTFLNGTMVHPKSLSTSKPLKYKFKFTERGGKLKNTVVNQLLNDGDGTYLTTHCILTFLEAKKQGYEFQGIDKIIISSRDFWDFYVERNRDTQSQIPNSVLVLLPYVEAKWEEAMKRRGNRVEYYLKPMEKRSIKSSGNEFKYWSKNSEPNPENPMLAVEFTSYALLTYLHRKRINDALPLVRWLLTQQNPNGGFYSTQDTIVALSALAKFAQMTRVPNLNLQVDVSYKVTGNQQSTVPNPSSVTISPENAAVHHEIFLPPGATQVKISQRGLGNLYAQISRTYYVKGPQQSKSFEIDITRTDPSPGTLRLKVCTRYVGAGETKMVIMEINLPSGYTFQPDSLNTLKEVPKQKRFELTHKNTKLDIYFDFMDGKANTCVNVEAMRVFKVGEVQPTFVRVYDYYDVSKKAVKYYEQPEVNYCEICQQKGNCSEANCV